MPLTRLPNAWLLFALLLLVAVYPFLQDLALGHAMVAFFDPAILGLALVAARASGADGRVGIALVLPAFVFGYLFAALGHVVPGSFAINAVNNPDNHVGWWDMLYFSFTCLTSVGFGEITPVNDHAPRW